MSQEGDVERLTEVCERMRLGTFGHEDGVTLRRIIDARDAAIERFRKALQYIANNDKEKVGTYVKIDQPGRWARFAKAELDVLTTPQPDAKTCKHININKYGCCEGCGVFGPFSQPDARAQSNQSSTPYSGTPCVCGERREEDCKPNDCDAVQVMLEIQNDAPSPSPAPREATCQQGMPCGDPDNCPDPVGCGFLEEAAPPNSLPPSAEDEITVDALLEEQRERMPPGYEGMIFEIYACEMAEDARQAGIREGRKSAFTDAAPAWEALNTALRMIRDAVQELGPVGCVRGRDVGPPDPIKDAEEIIEGIRRLTP